METNETVLWIKNLFSPDPEANIAEKMKAIQKALELEAINSFTKADLRDMVKWLWEYIHRNMSPENMLPDECATCIHSHVCEMIWAEKGEPCAFREHVAENTTTDTTTDTSTGRKCPDECRDCTHCETCGRVFENKGGPCPYREQGENEPTATTKDILNLAIAYAVVQKNKKVGNGYQINDKYYERILDALEEIIGKYRDQLKGDKETTSK